MNVINKNKSIKNKLICLIFNSFAMLSSFSLVFGSNGGGAVVPNDVIETLTTITRILLLIASAVCIGKIIHIGIMFVMSSAIEKSKAKEAMIPWIIGTIVCFGAATIGGAIVEIFTKAGTPPTVLSY